MASVTRCRWRSSAAVSTATAKPLQLGGLKIYTHCPECCHQLCCLGAPGVRLVRGQAPSTTLPTRTCGKAHSRRGCRAPPAPPIVAHACRHTAGRSRAVCGGGRRRRRLAGRAISADPAWGCRACHSAAAPALASALTGPATAWFPHRRPRVLGPGRLAKPSPPVAAVAPPLAVDWMLRLYCEVSPQI